MGRLFNALSAMFRAVTHRYRTEWEEPLIDEPAVFICNHAGAMGPLNMSVKFPLAGKLRLWCNEGIMNRKTCPDYIRHDFWWRPESRLAPFFSAVIPPVVSLLLPPILRSAPTIPVYHDARIIRTMRLSIRAMEAGEHMVIFPEIPDGFQSHAEEISTGWMTLCAMWYRKTGKNTRLYPVHIDYRKHVFHVCAPLVFDGSRPMEEQEKPLADALTRGLRGER